MHHEDTGRVHSLAALLTSLAKEIDARLVLMPSRQMAGQINFASGKRVYFRGTTLDINGHGAAEVARDKNSAAFFMKRMGFPAVQGESFFSPEWARRLGSSRDPEAALRHARRTGFPLVVKPNSGSGGRAVHVVDGEDGLLAALSEIFREDALALVQPVIQGREYRVVVLGSEAICAYERRPPSVVGDGRSTVGALLTGQEARWRHAGRPATIGRDDPRLAACLGRQRHDLATVPAPGERIRLLDGTNLSSGGEAADVTGRLDPSLERLCIDVSQKMGLRLSGVDLIVEGDGCGETGPVHILEINASPALGHYASLGALQAERVKDLYRKVLRQLERTDSD